MSDKITIPAPETAPFGVPVTPANVQQVWDTFVKPEQLGAEPQSFEMRALMGILRAVYAGINDELTAVKTMHATFQKTSPNGIDYYCACGWDPKREPFWRFNLGDGRSDEKQKEWVYVHARTANGEA